MQAKRILMGALFAGLTALGVSAARPAAAQVTFGSPGDPARVALGVGVFDFLHNNTAAELRGEYRFGDVAWIIAPFVGAQGTSDGAFYGYGGFGFDINFGRNWVLTPNAAVGYFARGDGKRLGSWLEFRTGAELDYRFADRSRAGLAFHHISNAGLTKRNPGEESLTLIYTVPLR